MLFIPTVRHLLRARDLADARYSEPLGVDDLARAAGLSRAHFSANSAAPSFGRSSGCSTNSTPRPLSSS
jgi:hypothetical protein